ncbi:MAG: sulfatase family protein [Phycisphaerales bacterium]
MAPSPNILWITFEDTSPRFGCFGDPVAQTPHVDRLAAGGCIFPNTFTTAPVCAPARSAVITGMYAISIGAHHMRTSHTHPATPELPTPYEATPPHYVRCVSQYLRAAGYYCTNNHKTDYQFDPPRTAWDVCDNTGHWRNRPDPDQPFFAVFNLDESHESYQWPEKGGEPKTDPARVTLPPYLPDTLECRKALARAYDQIASNDQRVGEWLSQLEEDRLADNTIVFIWSDHGEGLPRSKRWPYDTGLRVPMVVRYPGSASQAAIAPGGIDHRLVSTIDLGPTILSLAGLPVPCHMQGVPFLGPGTRHRPYIHASRDRYDESYDMVRAVRDDRYKYIRNFYVDLPRMIWVPYRNRHPVMREINRRMNAGTLEGPQQWFADATRPPEELYDTRVDPWELHNLADDPGHHGTLLRLRDEMDRWRRDVGDWGDTDENVMKHTWYPGGVQPRVAPVICIPFDENHAGIEAAAGCELRSPALVQLHCPTHGSSIAYTFDAGDNPRWLLYRKPIRLPVGTHRLRTLANRIGYKESNEGRAAFTVREPSPANDADDS